MSNDLEITILKPVENFVMLKNKLRKEMSETPAEDLEAYKRFEWEKWSEEWGNSWHNIKNDLTKPNLLAQVRDVLGYSVEQYPCTKQEIDTAYAKAKQEAAYKKQQAWDKLTPEEQSAKLKKNRKMNFIWSSIAGLSSIYLIFVWFF